MSFRDFLSKAFTTTKSESVQTKEQVNNSQSDIPTISPHSFDDVEAIIDKFILRRATIVRLNEVSDNTKQRVLDLLSGAIYALDGKIAQLDNDLFLFTF